MNDVAALGALPAAGTAIWLGVLTSVSPCPLASNIAAISYVGQGVDRPRRILIAGLLYAIGRAFTYALLGWILAASLANVAGLSNSLQSVMNQLMGPVLIITGMLSLQLLEWKWRTVAISASIHERAASHGLVGAILLGSLFALSFCPVSAALFFGSLIPLAVSRGESLSLPVLYGLGTGVPVLLFAWLIGLSAKWLQKVFERVTRLEVPARKTTGVVFVLAGVYYSLTYIFEVFE